MPRHPMPPQTPDDGRRAASPRIDPEVRMSDMSKETADALEGIARAESDILERLMQMQVHNLEQSGLDPRAYALVKLATLIAVDAPPASFVTQVAWALESGVTAEEILGVLIAAAPQVGIPRVVSAGPEVMLALGMSLDLVEA